MKTSLLIIVLGLALLIFSPFISIWSLNTIFQLGIAYTMQTWLAAIWLMMTTFGSVSSAVNNLKK